MALIGDILFSVRNKIPDLPPTLPAPSATVTVAASVGSTLPPGTYACVVTQRNPWGETLESAETGSLAIIADQGIHIVSTLLPGATAIRAYLTLPGGAPGTEIQFAESTTSPFTISTPPTGFAPPPSRATAYMLDADGPTFGASTVYSWLNEGLSELSRIVGGLLDYCGVPTAVGQPMYVAPGEWLEISDVWYGGYWVQGGKRAEFFRRNTVNSSILSRVTVSVFTDKQVIEVNYQPDRNSGVTATTASMSATDTSVAITNPSAFLLPFGFAQLGTGPSAEIVAYASLASGAMSGLIRGLGSSVAQSWPSSTTVTELSLFWCGKRLFGVKYSPGQAYTTLQAPQGWGAILPLWMLAQAKRAEQDVKQAMEIEKQFAESAGEWYRANKGVSRFVQVGGSGVPLTFDGTVAGGIIIPGP